MSGLHSSGGAWESCVKLRRRRYWDPVRTWRGVVESAADGHGTGYAPRSALSGFMTALCVHTQMLTHTRQRIKRDYRASEGYGTMGSTSFLINLSTFSVYALFCIHYCPFLMEMKIKVLKVLNIYIAYIRL